MGLIDQVEYQGTPKPIAVTDPAMQTDPDTASFDKWKVEVPEQTTGALFNQIKSTQKMGNEGVQAGNDAANALFNQNTNAFSRAISSRANRMMASNTASRTIQSELQNVKRQQMQQMQNMNDLNDIYKIKRQNFAGQLKFSAEMSNYYNQLSGLKLQALGSILGGGMSMAGKMAGGM